MTPSPLQELLAGLKRGVSSASGWLAAAELLLDQHREQLLLQAREGRGVTVAGGAAAAATAQSALDAAKEGLRYVAQRDFLGMESVEQVRWERGPVQVGVGMERYWYTEAFNMLLYPSVVSSQAGLLLRLAAGRALLACGLHSEAEALLAGLAERVSEGQVTFGTLAGLAPLSISQQAVRWGGSPAVISPLPPCSSENCQPFPG